jgi:predicted glutamine amidotransferase
MCRIFAVRSTKPLSVRPAFDRLRQLASEHKDGWGIATFRETGRVVERNTESAEVSSRFDALGSEHTSSMLVHIRLASVGTVHERNNHPFTAEPWVFMHNGTLKNFESHRAKFEAQIEPKIFSELTGETDSERCFALFRTYLGDSNDVAGALTRMFRTAETLCDDATEGKRSAMNFLVSDGRRFWATRRDRTLFAVSTPTLVAIASEPLLPDVPWQEVPQDSLVEIDEQLQLSMRPIS